MNVSDIIVQECYFLAFIANPYAKVCAIERIEHHLICLHNAEWNKISSEIELQRTAIINIYQRYGTSS